MTKRILYIPGFQEAENKRMPGTQLKQIAKENGYDFFRLTSPGAGNDNSTFSMTQLKNRIQDTLSKIDGESLVATYSLSSLPTIEAINNYNGEVNKLLLINPAYDPVHAVKIMDWLKNKNLSTPLERSHFLDGDVSLIFNRLIGGWEGNGDEFQKDLQYFDNRLQENKGFISLATNTIEVSYKHDMVTGFKKNNSCYPVVGRKKVALSHVPYGLSKIPEVRDFFSS